MHEITVTDPNTGAVITIDGGESQHGIWVTIENEDKRTFISAPTLLRMARNNATWTVANP